jgi:hypothetical protein
MRGQGLDRPARSGRGCTPDFDAAVGAVYDAGVHAAVAVTRGQRDQRRLAGAAAQPVAKAVGAPDLESTLLAGGDRRRRRLRRAARPGRRPRTASAAGGHAAGGVAANLDLHLHSGGPDGIPQKKGSLGFGPRAMKPCLSGRLRVTCGRPGDSGPG